MHRVIVKRLDHLTRWIVEVGPWLPSAQEAVGWANTFQAMGYVVAVEDMRGDVTTVTPESKLKNPLEAIHP